jgi:hypothetical protein
MAVFDFAGQGEMKTCTPPGVGGGPQTTSVRLDNRAADWFDRAMGPLHRVTCRRAQYNELVRCPGKRNGNVYSLSKVQGDSRHLGTVIHEPGTTTAFSLGMASRVTRSILR